MLPPEYIYIDAPRLNQYLEYYVPDPHAVRKTKGMEFKAKLPLPEASVSQREEARTLNVHERIASLESHLSANDCLTNYRPRDKWQKLHFVKETFTAHRVIVPQNRSQTGDTPAFRFWLSPGTEQVGTLCLLEDCRTDDGDSMNFSQMSTYTLLQSLVYYTRAALRKTSLQEIIPNDPPPNPYIQYDITHPPSLVEEHHNVESFAYDFITNPIELLTRWHCEVLPARRVTSLYRVREYGLESTNSFTTVSTFAYPIYIQAMA